MLTRTAICIQDTAAGRGELRRRTWPGSMCLLTECPVGTILAVFSLCSDSPFGGGKRANRPCVCLNGML